MSNHRPSRRGQEEPRGEGFALKALLQVIILLPILVALLFIPAGGLDWLMAWLLIGVFLAGIFVTAQLAFVLGVALFDWALVSNPFFSAVVRLQEDRGHAVAASGAYRYVRHPGYVGMLVMLLATPLVLGSVWAVIPAGVSGCLAILRAAPETACCWLSWTAIESAPGAFATGCCRACGGRGLGPWHVRLRPLRAEHLQ